MLAILDKPNSAEVTIVCPNSLQRDLIKEIYMKKRTASPIFVEKMPLMISIDELGRNLPLEYVIYTDVEGSSTEFELLKILSQQGQILSKLQILSNYDKSEDNNQSAKNVTDAD